MIQISDAFEVQKAAAGTTEPVPEEADHRGLVAGSGQQIKMIRGRPVPHHPDARPQVVALLESETADQSRALHNEKEVAVGPFDSSRSATMIARRAREGGTSPPVDPTARPTR